MDVLIENIGWVNFFAINYPIYYELIWEFYSIFSTTSLTDSTLNTAEVIKFRLLGQRFAYSITKFNKALGLIDDEYTQFEDYLNAYTNICNYCNLQSVHETLTHHPPKPFKPAKYSDSYL